MPSIFKQNRYWYNPLWNTHRDRSRRRRQERPHILEDATPYTTMRVIMDSAAGKESQKIYSGKNLTDVFAVWVSSTSTPSGQWRTSPVYQSPSPEDASRTVAMAWSRRRVLELDTMRVECIPRMGLQ